MHKTAIKFAVAHWINLGRNSDGTYYIAQDVTKWSMKNWSTGKTAKNAIELMKRFLVHNKVKTMPKRSILDLKK